MSGEDERGRMSLPEAAGMLSLPVESVEALVGAGYLHTTSSADGPRFALGDLKAFLARNAAGDPVVDLSDGSLDDLDPQGLLDALDGRSEDMARRALDLLVTVFPEAGRWPLGQQARFIEEARMRFEAILAVASLGDQVDDELIDELAGVGADAARSSTSLPEVLLVLRISRDLVVQTAVEVAEDRGRHWGLALSLLLTRVLPALDRLTDAIARGYWAAVMERQEESRARFANMVEQSTDGVYEVDVTGRVRYANTALGIILGRRAGDIVGARLIEVLDPATQFALDAEQSEVVIRRADGVVRLLDIRSVERRVDGELVGYDGAVRDMTAAVRFEELRNDVLALLGHELRQPLTVIVGLSATLEVHGGEFEWNSVETVGEKIRQQAERITRLADDLYEVSRLEYDTQLVNRRQLDIAATVTDAMAGVEGAEGVTVDIPPGLLVLADRRRVELVVANLVDNALRHGARPGCRHRERGGPRDRGPCARQWPRSPSRPRGGVVLPAVAHRIAPPNTRRPTDSGLRSCAAWSKPWADGSGTSPAPTVAPTSSSRCPPHNPGHYGRSVGARADPRRTRVRKTYRSAAQEVEALRGIDVDIWPGELVMVMGPSGNGKTTMLNCLSGLDDIDAGKVLIDGMDLHRVSDARRTAHRARRMGFVFQSFNLIPVFSAVENVELPLLVVGTPGGDARHAALDMLDRVGLGIVRCIGRRSCPAASNSVAIARRWCRDRRSCGPTSPPATSTAKRPRRCSSCCSTRTAPGRRSSS